jgi:hypothetical protein
LFKIATALETGADHDMWTFQRYAKWLDTRTQWYIPGQNPEPPDSEGGELTAYPPIPPVMAVPKSPRPAAIQGKPAGEDKGGGRLEIEAVEGGLENILKHLK